MQLEGFSRNYLHLSVLSVNLTQSRITREWCLKEGLYRLGLPMRIYLSYINWSGKHTHSVCHCSLWRKLNLKLYRSRKYELRTSIDEGIHCSLLLNVAVMWLATSRTTVLPSLEWWTLGQINTFFLKLLWSRHHMNEINVPICDFEISVFLECMFTLLI